MARGFILVVVGLLLLTLCTVFGRFPGSTLPAMKSGHPATAITRELSGESGARAVPRGSNVERPQLMVSDQGIPRASHHAVAGFPDPLGITATFSIVAVDPETGECGAAVASKYPAVGKVVPYVRAEAGAFCTQHWHHPEWGDTVLKELSAGKPPADIIADLLRDDPRAEQRQLAVIDMTGRTAGHNPTHAGTASSYWAAMSGRFYACQGNTLAGRSVITAMAAAYEDTAGSLTDRLMAALVAGDCAGGDHRGRLAAGIRVARKGVDGHWFELYVDKSDDAVVELARKYSEVEHPAKGEWRGGKQPFLSPCSAKADE